MNKELIENARFFAGKPFTNEQLDDILDLKRGTVADAVEREHDPLGRAVRAGRLVILAELYESVQESARRHSTPAQQMVLQLWQKVMIQ